MPGKKKDKYEHLNPWRAGIHSIIRDHWIETGKYPEFTEQDFKNKDGVRRKKQYGRYWYYRKCPKCGEEYYSEWEKECYKHVYY